MLAALVPELSRTRLQQWIREGRATVDEHRRRPRDPVEAGERIELRPPDGQQPADAADSDSTVDPTGERFVPQPIPLDIVHEDEALLVLDKPVGLVAHPGAGRPDGTLVNALLHHDPALAHIPRAGLVHRLDRDTTGLLVVARTLAAHHSLTGQLAAREMGREYLAVVRGRVIAGGAIDAPIARHPVHRTRMAVAARGGRHAITHYRVEARHRITTALSVRLETGRTHQIRVHLAHAGFPVVGDPDYGGRGTPSGRAPEAVRDALRDFGRQALHARRLTLRHPLTGEECAWTAPPPPDLAALLAVLEADAATLSDSNAGAARA